jgi:hypothetical protein
VNVQICHAGQHNAHSSEPIERNQVKLDDVGTCFAARRLSLLQIFPKIIMNVELDAMIRLG